MGNVFYMLMKIADYFSARKTDLHQFSKLVF